MLRSIFVLLLVCGVGFTACDSTTDVTLTDGELVIGEWTLTRLMVDGQDRTAAVLAFYERVTIEFSTSGAFTITVDPRDENQTVQPVRGDFGLNTESKTLVLTVESLEGETRETANYDFESETRLVLSLTTDGSLIEGVEGDAVVTLSKQSAD